MTLERRFSLLPRVAERAQSPRALPVRLFPTEKPMNQEELDKFVGSLKETANTVNWIATAFEQIEHEKQSKRGMSAFFVPLNSMQSEIVEALIELRRQINKILPSEKQLREETRSFNRMVKALRAN
jgi:hypothetical protein